MIYKSIKQTRKCGLKVVKRSQFGVMVVFDGPYHSDIQKRLYHSDTTKNNK
jgi:hypothetical protein